MQKRTTPAKAGADYQSLVIQRGTETGASAATPWLREPLGAKQCVARICCTGN